MLRSVIVIAALALTSSGRGARAQTDGDLVERPGFPSERSAPPRRLSIGQVSVVFFEHDAEVRSCVIAPEPNTAAARLPRVVNIGLVVTPYGRVATVHAHAPPLLASCLERTVRRWRFPHSEREESLVYPLHL